MAMSLRKDAHMVMCRSSAKENIKRYKSMKNGSMKASSQAMREKIDEGPTEFKTVQMECFDS